VGRYFLGILTAFLFIGSVCGMLYIFDQGDAVDLKPSVLLALSRIPGWEEVAEAYKLGLNESKYLEEQKRVLREENAVLEERAAQLLKIEEELELERKKLELERARAQRNNMALNMGTPPPTSGGGGNSDHPETVARLLETMKPEQAGENLLKLPFEKGLAVLALIEPRRAGKILATMPAEKSAKYLEQLSTLAVE
jgi:flagellar motility protein MotE (MotC chaperone)